MRLLMMDGSRILSSLVERLAPEGVEIVEVETFEEAIASLHENPPDAVIANLGPAKLPWREFREYCVNHEPKIPVLFESCVYSDEVDAGIGGLNHPAAFLTKPYTLEDLRRQLDLLLGASSAERDLDPDSERAARLASFPES